MRELKKGDIVFAANTQPFTGWEHWDPEKPVYDGNLQWRFPYVVVGDNPLKVEAAFTLPKGSAEQRKKALLKEWKKLGVQEPLVVWERFHTTNF